MVYLTFPMAKGRENSRETSAATRRRARKTAGTRIGGARPSNADKTVAATDTGEEPDAAELNLNNHFKGSTDARREPATGLSLGKIPGAQSSAWAHAQRNTTQLIYIDAVNLYCRSNPTQRISGNVRRAQTIRGDARNPTHKESPSCETHARRIRDARFKDPS